MTAIVKQSVGRVCTSLDWAWVSKPLGALLCGQKETRVCQPDQHESCCADRTERSCPQLRYTAGKRRTVRCEELRIPLSALGRLGSECVSACQLVPVVVCRLTPGVPSARSPSITMGVAMRDAASLFDWGVAESGVKGSAAVVHVPLTDRRSSGRLTWPCGVVGRTTWAPRSNGDSVAGTGGGHWETDGWQLGTRSGGGVESTGRTMACGELMVPIARGG